MSKSTFAIRFYARKNQVNRMGKAGIVIRITVSKMLGHTNIVTTPIYARITNDKIGRDMQTLAG